MRTERIRYKGYVILDVTPVSCCVLCKQTKDACIPFGSIKFAKDCVDHLLSGMTSEDMFMLDDKKSFIKNRKEAYERMQVR